MRQIFHSILTVFVCLILLLHVAPFNCTYKHLRTHLQLARLQPLHTPSNNSWASICDVGTCLEAPPPTCSPSGYALDLGGEGEGPALPGPHESTATILPPEKFSFISIPIKGEHQPPELCAIPLPIEYASALTNSRRLLHDLQSRVVSAISSTADGNGGVDTAARMSKSFMEWLASSGKAQHVLDLIRLDSDTYK